MSERNPIGWFEIHVSDFDAAKKFYGEVFGWEFKISQASKGAYWNIFTGENSIGGGFMKKSKPEHKGQAIILYVEVEDIDKILQKAVEAGGVIDTPKTHISDAAGYYALLKDNDNNTIGLWSKN